MFARVSLEWPDLFFSAGGYSISAHGGWLRQSETT